MVCFTRAVPRILVVRHGESEWNRQRRWQGWEDPPLTPEGEAQAAARGRLLAAAGVRPGAVYTSDLRRARRTAEILAAALGRDPAVADPDLRERHGGDWQGHTGDEIEQRWPGMRAAWRRGDLHAPPGGEADGAVLARVDAALTRAVHAAGGGDLVVVTHHGVLRMLSTRAGVPVTTLIPNLGGRWFDWDGGTLRAGDALAPLADVAGAGAAATE